METDRKENEISPVRIGFSIPKKKFKKAVHRNRLKRQLRESWRLQKTHLYEVIPNEKQLHMFFIYTGDAEQSFDVLQHSVLKAIEQIKKQIDNNG